MPVLNLTLTSKTKFNNNIYFLELTTDQQFEFSAGQLISLEVGAEPKDDGKIRKIYRSYSISGMTINTDKQSVISIMVNTRPGGVGSQFVANSQVGDSMRAVGPTGSFRLVENNHQKVFVATSTGLAPFIAMIEEYKKSNSDKVYVYFGVKSLEDNFATEILSRFDNLNIEICVDSPFDHNSIDVQTIPKNNIQNIHQGFVTNLILDRINDGIFTKTPTDFYLCGNPMMISNVETMLVSKGIKSIYKENFELPKISLTKEKI
jgi:all-trans-retinol 13,14-reductase